MISYIKIVQILVLIAILALTVAIYRKVKSSPSVVNNNSSAKLYMPKAKMMQLRQHLKGDSPPLPASAQQSPLQNPNKGFIPHDIGDSMSPMGTFVIGPAPADKQNLFVYGIKGVDNQPADPVDYALISNQVQGSDGTNVDVGIPNPVSGGQITISAWSYGTLPMNKKTGQVAVLYYDWVDSSVSLK